MPNKPVPPFSEEAKRIKPGIYRHFKGGEYKLLTIGRDSEDAMRELVIYQSTTDPSLVWVRPLSMFLEIIDKDNYKGPRFTFLREI